MAKRYYKEEMFAGKGQADRMQYEMGMMVQEDRSAMANLPQQVVMRDYPKNPYAMGRVPDTIAGVDNQIREDSKHQKSGRFPEKY